MYENETSMEGYFDDALMERIAAVLIKLVHNQSKNRDDTCFQKFSDLLRSRLRSSKQVDQCGIVPFLTSIIDQTDVETPMLVFSIHLVGILRQIPDLNKQQEELIETFLDLVLKENELTEPSVGTEYFNTLRKWLTFRSPAAKCLYVWKNEKELVLRCWRLLTQERSLFLTNAVLGFLKDYLGLSEDDVTESYTVILQNTVNHVCYFNDGDASILPAVLQLLTDIPPLLIKTLDQSVLQKLAECLAYAVSIVDKETSFCAIEALLSLQVKLGVGGEMDSIVRQLPQQLMDTDIMRSQKVCIKMLEKGLHKEMVKDLLLSPLYIVTGQTDLVQNTVWKTKQININSKSTCIQIILNSLETFSCTDNIPQDAMEATEKLFGLTHEDSSEQSLLAPYIFHSNKVQQRCLDLFLKNWCRLSRRGTLCWSVLDVLKTENLDNATLKKCYDVLCRIAPEVLTDSEVRDGQTFGQCLMDTVQYKLCCIDWEQRDTTLELLTKLVSSCQEHSGVTMWMLSGHLCRYVYQALEDSNSYTRASALTCLQKLLNSCELTAGLLQQCHITMDDVYRKVLRILQEDTEAFPRRECVSFITKTWHCVHSGFKDQIYEILAEGTSNDFDWEVKMKLVEFWEMLINQELLMTDVKLPSYAVQSSEKEQAIGTIQNIQELVKTKCFDCLLRLLDDYDQSVCEKACLLMIRLKDYLADVLQDSLTSNSLAKKRKTDDSPTDMESIYEKLKALDLTCRLLQVSRTCDEYDKNPMSLLEDMLSYQTDRPHDLTSPHHDTNAVDCY